MRERRERSTVSRRFFLLWRCTIAEIIKTFGQHFSSGDVIEVIRSRNAADLQLLHWDGSVGHVTSKVNLEDKVYEPDILEPSFARAVRLPSNMQPHSSAAALLADLATSIEKFAGLSNDFARLMAFFIIGTWTRDAGSIAPRLTLFGPPSREIDQATRLLNCCCFHGVPLAGITPVALLALPFEFGLTLVIRDRKLSPQLISLMDACIRKSQFVVRHGNLINPFCSIAVIVQKPIDDAFAFVGLEIPVSPTLRSVPFLDPLTEEQIAVKFQNSLLAFRVSNSALTRNSGFDPADLSSPLRELGRSLGACLSNDIDLQTELIGRLRNTDRRARILQSTNQEAVLVEALLFFCHERRGEKRGLHVQEIAAAMNVINTGRGEAFTHSPRSIGELLRAVGFETSRLDRNGRGIMLCGDINSRVHELAMDLGVPSMREGTPGCETCKCVLEVAPGQKKGP